MPLNIRSTEEEEEKGRTCFSVTSRIVGRLFRRYTHIHIFPATRECKMFQLLCCACEYFAVTHDAETSTDYSNYLDKLQSRNSFQYPPLEGCYCFYWWFILNLSRSDNYSTTERWGKKLVRTDMKQYIKF